MQAYISLIKGKTILSNFCKDKIVKNKRRTFEKIINGLIKIN